MRHFWLILSVLLAVLSVALASDINASQGSSGGIREKKSINDQTNPDNSLLYSPEVVLEKRIPSAGFHGMRGKKLHNDLLLPIKRSPMGFMGMRGKKEIGYIGNELDKRATKGFLGMRGKKEFDNHLNEYYKRAPNGFMGMRGKKEYSLFMEEAKRAPSNAFFGMRGKKQPTRSAFFVMRGKKYPYEFREKFVGVRGKKQSEENDLSTFGFPEDVDIVNNVANLNLKELMVLLSEEDKYGSNVEKDKESTGFLGLHG